MNENSGVINALCSHLCMYKNVKPYEPREIYRFIHKLNVNNILPSDILKFSYEDFKYRLYFSDYDIERINRLIDRYKDIESELKKYANLNIKTITICDDKYPSKLRNKLHQNYPPILYYSGNTGLLNRNCIGIVGVRDIDVDDYDFTSKIVSNINKNGYGIVSGGARGVDTAAYEKSVSNGNICIEYVSDSLLKKIQKPDKKRAILNNQLIMLSVANPDSNFSTCFAMARNKLIYIQSDSTVAVRANLRKGGTWNGAVDCIKNKYCTLFCWNNEKYEGNMELIKMGAVAIDEKYDFKLYENNFKPEKQEYVQLSLFD